MTLRARLRPPAAVDPGRVGVSFVDVLFALVVGEVLTPLEHWNLLPAAAWSHLAVAAVLVLTSWIGYHISHYRQRYEIHFFNLPLWQLVLDVLLVATYFLVVKQVEFTAPSGEPGAPDYPAGFHQPAASARPEALLIAVTFALYVVWDWSGWRIAVAADRYHERRVQPHDRVRRWVTAAALAASLVLLALAWGMGHRPVAVVALDLGLIAVLLGYRTGKQAMTFGPDDLAAERKALGGRWHGVLRAVDGDLSSVRRHGEPVAPSERRAARRAARVVRRGAGRGRARTHASIDAALLAADRDGWTFVREPVEAVHEAPVPG